MAELPIRAAGYQVEQLRGLSFALILGGNAVDRGAGPEAKGLRNRGRVVRPTEMAFVDFEVVDDVPGPP